MMSQFTHVSDNDDLKWPLLGDGLLNDLEHILFSSQKPAVVRFISSVLE